MLVVAAMFSLAMGGPCGGKAPAAPTVEQITKAGTAANLIALFRLPDGKPAPANISLSMIANRDSVFSFMRSNYPASLRDDTTKVPIVYFWTCLDTAGVMLKPQLLRGTGVPSLDSLAWKVIKIARLDPARVDGKAIDVWIPMGMQLTAKGVSYKPAGDTDSRPVFTPYTVKPQLQNRDEINRAMVANYPESLRAAKVGGTVLVWLFVDSHGVVKRTLLKTSSGQPLLDEAALKVGQVMRFSPALNRDVPVDVWIQVPIVFYVN